MACKYILNGREYTGKELLNLASTGTSLMSVRTRTNDETIELMKKTAGDRFVNLDLFTPYQEAMYINSISVDIIHQLGSLKPKMEIKTTPKKTFLNTKARFENSLKVYDYLISRLDTNEKLNKAKQVQEYLDKFPQLANIESIDDLIEKRNTFKGILDNFDNFKTKVKINLRKFGLIINESSDKFEELKFDEEYYRTLINEEETEESFTEEERFIRESFEDGSAFLKNPRDTASARVKQFFAVVPSGRFNSLGLREYMSYDEIIENFLQIGSELPVVNYENLQKALKEKSKGRPYLMNISAMLGELKSSRNTTLLNEILTFANKAFQEQILVKWNKAGVGVDVKIMKSNRSNVIFQIYEDWLEGQKTSKIITSKNGQLVVDNKVAAALKKSLGDIRTGTIADKKAWVKKFMSTIGVEYTDGMIDELEERANKGLFKKGGKNAGFNQLFEENNLFSLIVNKYNSPITGKTEVAYDEANNALKDEHSSFNILAEIYYDFTPGRYYTSSSRNGENKSIYAYIEPSMLERLKKKLKYGTDQFGEILKRAFAKSSNVIQAARKSKLSGKNNFTIEIDYADSLKQDKKGRDGVVRKYQSPKEQTVEAIFKHQNNGSKTGLYNIFTLSNKTVTPVISITKYKLNDKGDGRAGKDIIFRRYEGGSIKNSFDFGQTFKNELYNLAESEINRIVEYSKELKAGNNLNEANFDKAFELFYLFPILNKGSKDENGARMETIRNKMYQGEYPSKEDQEYIKNELVDVFKERVVSTISTYVKDGIIAKEVKDGKVDLSFPFFDNGYMSQQEVNGLTNLQKAIYSIADFKFNYLRTQVTALQMLGTDPALFYKAPKSIKKGVDINTLSLNEKINIVRTTMDEFSKRAAMFIAPGGQGVWTWYDENGKMVDRSSYRTITMNDVVLDVPLGGDKVFTGVETTDAQEFITLQEHIDRLLSRGRIPLDIWQSITNKIVSKLGSNYQLSDREKGFVFQPLKPVYTNSTEVGGQFTRVDYVKSSSYPLIPDVIAGSPLDELRKMMENNNIRSGNFKSAKKTGQPGKSVTVFDEKGNFVMPSKKDLEGATQVLSREGLHDQQEIPPQKEEIANISQMNRTLFDGLMDVEDFVLEGEEFNGKDFKKLKENIRISLFSMAKSDMLSRFGFVEFGKSLKLKNKKAFESLLLEEALERGYSLNDVAAIKVDENGDLIIPPYLMARSEKFEGLINSLLTKIVKQKNPGTSLIQVSGVTSTLKMSDLSKDVKNDIIWLPSYDPKAGLMYMRKGPDVIDRKGKVKKGDVKPAQVIVSQYIRDEEGNLIDLSKFVKKDKNGRNILDTSSFSEELFQLVASRIPNQSHPSTLPIEVVGFLPSYMENTIIVPNGITKQMGSDFDVDKLYAYLSTFRFRYSKKTENTIKDLEKKKFDAKQTNEQTNTELFKKLLSTDEANLIKDLKSSKSKIIDKMKWDISQKEKTRKQKSIDNLNKLISNLYENIKTRNEKEYLSLKRQQEINNKKLDIELANIDKEIAQAKSEGIVGVNKVSYDLSKYDGTYESLLNNMGEDELHQMYRDLHWSVLTHPETFDLITKSIDFPDISEEEKLLESIGLFDSDTNYTPMDVEEQIQVFIDNKSGGVGTGVFANLGSFLGDNQDKNIILGYINEKGNKVINPITVLDDEGNELDLYKVTEYGSVEFERKEGDEVFLDKRTKADNNTMLLSESVDNAKNKKLYKFNWSDQNMSAITGIIALSSENNEILKINFATRFFKQNIVVDYNKELANLKDSLNDFIPNADAIASAKIVKKYQDMMSEEALKERVDAKAEDRYKPVLFGAQNLLQFLKDGKLLQGYMDVLLDDTASLSDKKTAREFIDKYANAQLDLFDLYLRFDKVGVSLGKVISAIYPYAKGVGSTIFDLIDNSRKLNNLSKSNLFLNLEQLAGPITTNPNTGRAELLEPKGEIGQSIDMSIMLGEKIYEQLYPIHFSANYKDLVDKVFAGLGIDKNTIGSSRFIKLNKQLIKAIRSYLFTSPSLELAYDIPSERQRLLFESEDNVSLAKRIEEAKVKYPELEKNYFFNNLKTRVSTVNGGTSQVYYNNPFGDVDELENNKGYLSLIFSGNDELISIAKDLALYTYITGGNQNNSSFGKFIPVEYFMSDKDFIKGMQGLASNFYGGPLNPIMYKQIIQNNPDLATRIDKKVFDIITAVKDYKNQEKFTVDVNNEDLLNSFLVSSVISDGLPAGIREKFADFVVYYDPQSSRNYLYERISPSTKGVYQRINTLGTSKSGFVEYSFNDEKVNSLLQINMTAAQYAEYAGKYKQDTSFEDNLDLDSLSDSFFSDPDFDLSDIGDQFDESYDNINLDDLSQNSNYTPTEVDLKNPALYTDHSGGAEQADSVFDEMGKRYGVVNYKHYYDSSSKVKPPLGNTPLNKQQMQEGIAKVKVTYAQLQRPDNPKYYSLHGRNWFQVKNADAIFAVSDLIAPGEMGRKGFINKSGISVVEGGTGYAVQMAINEGKPVYVYHQNVALSDTYDEGWYMYDYNSSQFVKTQTPKLTLNFAGIGTSTDLTAEGVEAIEDLYKNTFGNLAEIDQSEITTSNTGIEVEYAPKGKNKQTYTVIGGKIFNSKGQEVFKEDSRDRNKIYANVAVKQGRAVIVTYRDKRYVVNDRNQIISVQTGDMMKWGEENGDRKSIIALADDLRNYNLPVDEENLVEEDMVNNNMMTDPVLTQDELAANIDPDRLIGMDEMDNTEVNIENLDNQPVAQKRGEIVEQINDPITSQLIPDLNGINDAKKIVDNIFKTTNNPFFKTLGKTISTAFLNKVSIVVDTNLPYPGVYNSNLIRINPSLAKIDNSALSAKDNLETVIMHEIMHAYTADIINKFQSNPSSLTPKVRDFADKINKMHIKTRNELMKDPKHATKLSSVIAALSSNTDNIVLDQSDKSNYYGLTNLNEFVSMIMTDRGFQQFMNTVMYEVSDNQSVYEKFKALLKELISALASSIGIPVQPDSVLNSGVSSVVGIIKERETQDFTPAENDNTGDANESSFKIDDINKEDLGEYDLLTPNGVFDANEDQVNAINKVSDFFSSPIQDKLEDNVFLLYGPGGTGKTASLASAIRKSLKQTTVKPKIAYAAISHTAKGELVKAGNEEARTFASLVGARPVVSNTGEESFELLPLEEFTKDEYPVPFPDIFTADWIIIDESSMIGDREMKAIRQRLNERQSEFGQSSVKILFMGDYAQIAPVGVEPDGDGWPIKLMNNIDKSVGLSKVERTKNQDITDIGFRFRRAVDYYNEQLKKGIASVATPLKAAQILSSDVTTSTANVKFTKNESTFIKDFVDIFRKDPLNSANAVIISYNNEKHINTVKTTDVIRKSLFGKAAENNLFLPGEPVFITSTITTKDLKKAKSIELSTNSRVIIKNIKSINKEFNVGSKYYPRTITVPIYDMEAYFGDVEVNIQAFDKSFLAQLKNYTKKNGKGGYELEDGSFLLYSDLMKLKQDKGLTDIFHGYVMSSHKVQGQTYGYPFVNEKNIFSFIRMGADNKLILTPKDYSRIMYTAVSRAKNKVYILSDRTKDETGTFVNPVVEKPMQSIGTQDVFETEFPKDLELENQCKI